MNSRALKSSDLCNITGTSRHVIRGLLDRLPIASKKATDKTDQVFSATEFLVIVICFEIEFRYGIQRSYLHTLYPVILDIISKPRSLANEAKLLISVNPVKVQYFDGAVTMSEGLLVPLMYIFEKVDTYLSPVHTSLFNAQRPLDLGPVEISTNDRNNLKTTKNGHEDSTTPLAIKDSHERMRRVGGVDE